MRPSDGYLLFAPCGPCWSKFSAREMTLPLRTRRAAATMSSAEVLLSVPISSAGPHLPQLLYFSAALARSLRVSFAAGIASSRLFFWRTFYRLTLDMSGSRKTAQLPLDCPLAGLVR